MSELSPLFVVDAQEFIENKKFKEALELCQKGVDAYPDYPAGYRMLIKALLYNGENDNAFEIANKAKELFPNNKLFADIENEIENDALIDSRLIDAVNFDNDTDEEITFENIVENEESENNDQKTDTSDEQFNNEDNDEIKANESIEIAEDDDIKNEDSSELNDDLQNTGEQTETSEEQFTEEDNDEIKANESIEIAEDDDIKNEDSSELNDDLQNTGEQTETSEEQFTEEDNDEIKADESIEIAEDDDISIKSDFEIDEDINDINYNYTSPVKYKADNIYLIPGFNKSTIEASNKDADNKIKKHKEYSQKILKTQTPATDEYSSIAEEIKNTEIDAKPTSSEKQTISNDNNAELVSETLADIYSSQGAYEEAILAYEKLIEINPDKKKYFLDKINKVKLLKDK